ncbi:unnamed protein product [Owenia fusiformis]|uniref:Uncharacterized protein n=1 Tax=Owenia fusiformis TaxID=6347 RepID=A0A8J1XW04_OWEFU|nr:unnamed protein product [Owenia fusiformis]
MNSLQATKTFGVLIESVGKPSFNTGRWSSRVAAAVKTPQEKVNVEYDNAKPFSDIPGPRGLPVFGTLFQYTRGPYTIDTYPDALIDRYKEYGPIFKETIAGNTIVHIFDPEEIKKLYAIEGKTPHVPPLLETMQMYRKYRDMSPGLGNVNGEEWYRLRSAVQQMMMRPKSAAAFLPLVNEVVDDFIIRINQIKTPTGEVLNINNELLKFTLESATYTCFEKRLNTLDAGEESHTQKMINCNHTLLELSTKLKFKLPLFKYISTPMWKKLVDAEDFFYKFGQTLVDETVAKIKELSECGELQEGKYDFMAYLLGRKELTYKDISIVTLSLFADGLSTTAPILAWQLYCLAKHPDQQEKAFEEVRNLCHKDEPITARMIGKMPYLKACIKESFRFFPIGPDVSREPTRDVVVSGYQIPAGTNLSLNNNLLLRLPEFFSDAEKYIPERWLREGSGESVHPYVLTPFGHGPRMCAGRRFAEQDIHVLLIKLLLNFRMEWGSDKELGKRFRILFTPDRESSIKFIPRY